MIMDHNYKVDTVIHMYFRVNNLDAHVEYEVPLGELIDIGQDELDISSKVQVEEMINMGRQEWLAERIDSGWKVKE